MSASIRQANAIVLGAGSWGTALAQLLAANGHAVTLWMRDVEQADAINSARENTRYLPDAPLHDGITATAERPDFAAADLCLSVIPAQYTRPQLQKFAQYILCCLAQVLPVMWSRVSRQRSRWPEMIWRPRTALRRSYRDQPLGPIQRMI